MSKSKDVDLEYVYHQFKAELQKRADRADQLVLFFLGKAREKQAKTRENRRKHAKTGEKQALFWC